MRAGRRGIGPDRGGRSRGRVAALVALAVAASGCVLVGPPPDPGVPEGSVLADCSVATGPLVLDVSTHLDPDCEYTGGIRIVASEVTLDCRGALLRGEGGTGILVVSPADVTLHDVVVRNCRTEGFLNGMKLTRDGFRDLAEGEEYDEALRDVRIERSSVADSHGVGIFVDGYVTDVLIDRVRVEGAGSAGIYLETGSRRTTVTNSMFVGNGFRENGPGGRLFTTGGMTFAYWGPGREGLAIDGSSDNVVAGNLFHGNAAGGVFLYTNCGEYPDRNPGRYFERRYPSDRNVVANNVFAGGWHGVWVGSRMGENLFPMECANDPYHTAPFVEYTLDRAADNTVTNNHFVDVSYGVRVEDDGTRVLHNRFLGTGGDRHAIVVGTPHRTAYLGQPVRDTVVVGNRSEITANPSPYRWVHGVDGLVDVGNTVHGTEVAMCEGAPLPRGPFVMVLAVALANPDGTLPPPPADLAPPVLGPLAPCPA